MHNSSGNGSVPWKGIPEMHRKLLKMQRRWAHVVSNGSTEGTWRFIFFSMCEEGEGEEVEEKTCLGLHCDL